MFYFSPLLILLSCNHAHRSNPSSPPMSHYPNLLTVVFLISLKFQCAHHITRASSLRRRRCEPKPCHRLTSSSVAFDMLQPPHLHQKDRHHLFFLLRCFSHAVVAAANGNHGEPSSTTIVGAMSCPRRLPPHRQPCHACPTFLSPLLAPTWAHVKPSLKMG